jgi:hypothetical protein
MHEILAFSAFHKAFKQPEQRHEYYSFGIHHQDLAIRGIRERLHNFIPQEAPAMIATSTLLTLSVFASTGFEAQHTSTDTYQSAIDGILNIFNLMQGMRHISARADKSITESFVAPMFKNPSEAIPSQPLLDELAQRLPALIGAMKSKPDLPECERNLYLVSLEFFESVLQLAMRPRIDNRELRFLFFWPVHLSPEFLSNLRQRRPGALVILMYYATILFASEPRYWFMNGWGKRLMQECYDAVDQSWMSVIQWPSLFLITDEPLALFVNLSWQRQPPGTQAQTSYMQLPAISLSHRQQVPGPSSQEGGRAPDHSQPMSPSSLEDQKPAT